MSDDAPERWIEDQGQSNEVSLGHGVAISHLIRLAGEHNRLIIESGVSIGGNPFTRDPVAIQISGRGSEVIIREGARLNVMLNVSGDGCRVFIGRECIITVAANVAGHGGVIDIGDHTTIVHGALQVHEPGSILIGRDCMISTLVYVSVSDIHPIYDRATGARINAAASVTIGDHVWLGLRSMIMKGASIDTGAVVAAGSIVSGHVPAHTIVGGSPARVLRENVDWARDFLP
ncbi:acyltransferase [Brevundimonas sp. SL161]|uniref:acyltransferase n=1 Tax=Brevundimonas sp. SL161 TaxID=2804613 RepID=UPI003CE82C41